MQSVSIIIPNYNHAPYLEERMKTILSQTYQNFEIIILDDCSTDNSKVIIEQYRTHPKTRHIIFNKKNSGSTFKQWKLGLEKAKYDLVWIAESDDFSHPEFLETAVKSFEKNKNQSLFFCNSRMVDQHSGPLEENTHSYGKNIATELFLSDFIMHGHQFVSNILFEKNLIQNASAVVFKKKDTLSFLPKILDFKMCGDWLFWSIILSKGDIGYSKNELNYFRYIAQSTRNHNSEEKKKRRIFEEMQVMNELISLYKIDALRVKTKTERLLKQWLKLFRKREILNPTFLKPASLSNLKISKFQLIKFAVKK